MSDEFVARPARFERTRAFFRKWWRTGLPFFLTVLATLGGVWTVNWLSRTNISAGSPQTSIEENWNATIRSMGVSPIFPPEEDLVVGDVLAVVAGDLDPDPIAQADKETRRSFVSKSVKLAHINVSPQLDDAYSSLPVFPEAFPADTQSPYRNLVARKFSDAVVLGNLPRAAFPRLKIQGINAAAASLAVAEGRAADYASASQNLEEFELSDVRTYGLPSVTALALLKTFCESNGDVCQEATARKHLERVVGPRINNRYVNLKSSQSEYAMTVEVVMVYRVYLTSSIVDLRRSEGARRGFFSALWPFGSSQQPQNANAAQPSPSSAGDRSNDLDPIKAMSNRIDELQRKVSSIQSGASLGYESLFGNESSLEGRFQRPVAIGYRSVKNDFATGITKE